MKILNKRMTLEQFKNYLLELKTKPWQFHPKRICLHHTSSPVESWQGSGSMLHYWNLYRSRGWKAGPHIFIAPNGVWLFTPLNKRGKTSSPALRDCIHIEIVGRYYTKDDIMSEELKLLSQNVIILLKNKYNIFGPNKTVLHADYPGGENCSHFVNPFN